MTEMINDYEDNIKNSEILMEEFQKSEEDIKAGRIIDYSEFEEKLRTKYNKNLILVLVEKLSHLES